MVKKLVSVLTIFISRTEARKKTDLTIPIERILNIYYLIEFKKD